MAPENEGPSTPASAPANAAASGQTSGDGAGPAGSTGPNQTSRNGKSQLNAWAEQGADSVVQGVEWLKARTTARAQTALRALLYGLVIIVSVITAIILLIAGFVRLWDVYVPVEPLGQRVWLGYVAFGGLLFLVGAFLLLRKGKDEE